MGRTTDTRARTAEMADRIIEEGGVPTPTLVRQRLGGRGSPNTIVEALRDWRARRLNEPIGQFTAASGDSNAPRGGAIGVPCLEARGSWPNNEERERERTTTAFMQATAEASLSRLEQLEETCRALVQVLQDDRSAMRAELAKINDRFEAVQRRMLLAIDDAREDTRKWKETALATRDEAQTWKTMLEQRANASREEAAVLRGKLAVFTEYFNVETVVSRQAP